MSVDGAQTNEAPSATRPGRRKMASLEFNAIALMASTGITALVGLGFWAIAAQLPAAEVGRASALLSTATMLSQLASSNVGVLFGRVLASAGARSMKVVLLGYAAAAAVGGVLGVGFVLIWPTDDLFVADWERATFPLLVILLCIFTLQDWVLIGTRKSGWVPIEQLVFAIAKLGLLLWFAAISLTSGILLSWAIPVLVLVVVINPILLLRVLPGRPPPAEGAAAMPDRRTLINIFLAEYATGTVTVVIPLMLPLLVVTQLGTQANAYYALPWLIAESLSLLMWNISSSYMVEASHAVGDTAALMRRTLRMSFLVCIAGVSFLLVTAPWLLSFLGPDYAEEGTTVLRLMVLAIPFTIITTVYINTARVRNQMGRVIVLQLLLAIAVIVLAIVLMGPLGIDGTGWAYLAAQAAAGLAVLVPVLRSMRGGDAPGDPTAVDLLPTELLPVLLPLSADPDDDVTRPLTITTRGPRT